MLLEVPLTPLIDTALTLLIIFMIASPMMHNAVRVNLPQGKAQDEGAAKQPIVVYIDKQEKIYLNDATMGLKELIAQLTPELLERSDGAVYVKADQEVHYGKVIQVVDALKVAGGVRSVGLSTKRA
jgi:biopolymer transport protein ExbD